KTPGRSKSVDCQHIAEGNGKRSPSDRCRFLDIATGSAMECAACLDGLVARRQLARNPLELERQCFFESSRCCAVWWSAFSDGHARVRARTSTSTNTST